MIKYYVNAEKNTVVAKMEYDCIYDILDEVVQYAFGASMRRMFGQNAFEYSYIIEDFFRDLMRPIIYKHFTNPIIGKAKFSPEDKNNGCEFDVEFGKKMARMRCLEQYYFRLALCCEDAYNLLTPMMDTLADRHDSAVDSVNKWCDEETTMLSELMLEEV